MATSNMPSQVRRLTCCSVVYMHKCSGRAPANSELHVQTPGCISCIWENCKECTEAPSRSYRNPADCVRQVA